MLDIRFVRENPEIVKENIKKKFQDEKLPLVDEVIALDEEKRAVQKMPMIFVQTETNFQRKSAHLWRRVKRKKEWLCVKKLRHRLMNLMNFQSAKRN